MIRYLATVFCSPGRRVVRSRTFTAPSDELACAQAVRVAEQWAHRAGYARYRVTWRLDRSNIVAGGVVPVAAGRLTSAGAKRRAQ